MTIYPNFVVPQLSTIYCLKKYNKKIKLEKSQPFCLKMTYILSEKSTKLQKLRTYVRRDGVVRRYLMNVRRTQRLRNHLIDAAFFLAASIK